MSESCEWWVEFLGFCNDIFFYTGTVLSTGTLARERESTRTEFCTETSFKNFKRILMVDGWWMQFTYSIYKNHVVQKHMWSCKITSFFWELHNARHCTCRQSTYQILGIKYNMICMEARIISRISIFPNWYYSTPSRYFENLSRTW